MRFTKLVACLLSSCFFLGFTEKSFAFVPTTEIKDLSSNHWAYKAIESLVEKYGVMSGYPDKTFKGSKNMTRYELASALYKVMTRVEELIAKANKSGTSDTNNEGISKEDLQTIVLLQNEFKSELDLIKGEFQELKEKVNKSNKFVVSGNVELKYRDRAAVTDSKQVFSPLNGIDGDSDGGINNFNDPIRNLITEFDRTPFRAKATIDIKTSLGDINFLGTLIADDGTVFKLGNLPGQAIGGHFFTEGLSGNSLFPQKLIVNIKKNFDRSDKKILEINAGLMNFNGIVKTGTKFKNHFNSEKWIGHGYGLVGFGSDDILVRDKEITVQKDGKEVKEFHRNSVSRFWASGINVSRTDPDSNRYNLAPSPSLSLDFSYGPFTFFVGGNAGSPFVNRLAALNGNLGTGNIALVDAPKESQIKLPNTGTTQINTSQILTGNDFVNDIGGAFVNQKVIIGSKDVLFGRTTQNLLDLPSEYGDGYGLISIDMDLGFLRFNLSTNDYWLDSLFTFSGTRKSISGVLDIGNENLGISLQANYYAIGLDTYSASLLINNLGNIDFGLALKTATRGIFNFSTLTGTNFGFYLVSNQYDYFPKFMIAARQTLGDFLGSPRNLLGNEIVKLSTFKDSGITLQLGYENVPFLKDIGIDLEYNGLIEGALWSGNFMAHDIGIFTNYKF